MPGVFSIYCLITFKTTEINYVPTDLKIRPEKENVNVSIYHHKQMR